MRSVFTSLFYGLPRTVGEFLAPLLLLLVRAVIGIALAQTGFGKVTHLANTSAYFEQLGIPLPGVNAAVVGGLELVGGVGLLLGLGTRFFAAALTVALTVATLTGERELFSQYLQGEKSFNEVAALTFVLILVLLWVQGAGAISLDAIATRKANAAAAKAKTP